MGKFTIDVPFSVAMLNYQRLLYTNLSLWPLLASCKAWGKVFILGESPWVNHHSHYHISGFFRVIFLIQWHSWMFLNNFSWNPNIWIHPPTQGLPRFYKFHENHVDISHITEAKCSRRPLPLALAAGPRDEPQRHAAHGAQRLCLAGHWGHLRGLWEAVSIEVGLEIWGAQWDCKDWLQRDPKPPKREKFDLSHFFSGIESLRGAAYIYSPASFFLARYLLRLAMKYSNFWWE